VLASSPAHSEDELAAKYGQGKGFDTSLVDQQCFATHCSLAAKECLADDPDCRKGLTCTAKCMGDNSCITGCMARYGNVHLDNLLKCSIEEHECIKVAILPGGADSYGEEPLPPAPTVQHFDVHSLEGTWYKVLGYNPNYDCYACQRNVFSKTQSEAPWLRSNNDKLHVNVEFAMPHLMPEGITNNNNNIKANWLDAMNNNIIVPIGLNEYVTQETMVFDNPKSRNDKVFDSNNIVLQTGKGSEGKSYARTAHSEGEMFGLKFWENWYVIGQNDPGKPEFKFIYYNGKTRQNRYDGAFVYSRTKELDLESMKKVYQIAADAGMKPDQFCKIRNGCFVDEQRGDNLPEPLRGILASTKVSQLLGVYSVAAEEGKLMESIRSAQQQLIPTRPWWKEVGDYLEDPHKHFKTMESLRLTMEWPDVVKPSQSN